MANYIYTIEDAKNQINAGIIELKETLAAWETVTRVTKKDGGDFANVERNFQTSGKETRISFEYSAFLSKVIIHYHSKINGYTYATVYIERGDKAGEIDYKIDLEKRKLADRIAEHERGYKAAEKRLKKAEKHLDALRDILLEAKKDGSNYTLRDYMENYLMR